MMQLIAGSLKSNKLAQNKLAQKEVVLRHQRSFNLHVLLLDKSEYLSLSLVTIYSAAKHRKYKAAIYIATKHR